MLSVSQDVMLLQKKTRLKISSGNKALARGLIIKRVLTGHSAEVQIVADDLLELVVQRAFLKAKIEVAP